MVEEECIFCSLAKSHDKIYEDNICYVMPDKYPTELGHLLVIVKEHHENMLVTPDKTVTAMYLVAKKYGQIVTKKLKADALVISTNIGKEAGQIIFHFHIHLIPKYSTTPEGFIMHQELTNEKAEELKKLLS
jgi:histidine triad (HIT) family protein